MADSIYVKDPEEFNVSYAVFSGNQYYNCKIKSVGQNQNAEEECDSRRENINKWIPCLSKPPPLPPKSQTAFNLTNWRNNLIWILVAILVAALLILVVVIIVYFWYLKRKADKKSENFLIKNFFDKRKTCFRSNSETNAQSRGGREEKDGRHG
jgi:flagellar basal body-associated protein FliL